MGIDEFHETELMHIYPNPTHDVLFIEIITNSTTLEILNSLGAVVYSKKSNTAGTLKIDTQSWTSGVYLIRVKAENESPLITKKIIKN